ncbi:hypothetical protein B0O99DRAFT_652381 [Bisporella sp. PMI_857]|nr:hypothetical protein B0O99DRAFT_652381 [Bisporella sp. PMI_857]
MNDSEDLLRRNQTANSITISPELFEKIYLSHASRVKGDLRSKLANPTPLQAKGLVGFVAALTPLCCVLMGWRGAGGGGATEMAFSLSFGTTLTPFYNASGAYGTDTAGFHASFGFFPLFMGLLCAFYFVCALRTNIVIVIIFFFLIIVLGLLTAAHRQIAQGHMVLAEQIDIAAGATAFVPAIAGWCLSLLRLLEALDFPFQLPVGDLTSFIQSRTQKAPTRNAANNV